MQAEIIAQMGAQLYAAGIDMTQAIETAAALLKKAQEREHLLNPGRINMSLHAVNHHLGCRAEQRVTDDGRAYDVIDIGHDFTLFCSREQTKHLRDVLSALIDSEAKSEAA